MGLTPPSICQHILANILPGEPEDSRLIASPKKANDERGKRRRVGVRRLRSQKDPKANTLELDSPTNLDREWQSDGRTKAGPVQRNRLQEET